MSWILDQQEVHMTVGSSVRMAGGRPNLHNDLQMVKAALLYADHAKLVSLSSSALLEFVKVAELPKSERLAFLKGHIHWFKSDEARQNVAELIRAFEDANKRRYSRRGREELRELQEIVDDLWRQRQQTTANLIGEQIGAAGIIDALQSGLLEIHAFDTLLDRIISTDISEDALKLDYIKAISPALTDSQTYALFDEDTSGIITQRVTAGDIKIEAKGMVRGKEVALAADLLARLPLFESASISEVLDIRRELEKPLQQFRSAMIRFSTQIESASWDKDFAQDADQVFRSEVAPAVLALEDEEKSNSFLNKLTAKVADKSLQVGGAVSASGAISALAVRMLNLPLADVAALAVGPAIVAGGVAYSAYREWKEKQKEIEGNSLFFYYKAGSLLEDGSFQYED